MFAGAHSAFSIYSSMAAGKRWTRDQLLIVLNLYHKLRFGQLDSRQPVIIDLAKRMGRTSGSVAMKLNNLASLDPSLKLRGIRGLEGASNLDRATWEEFHVAPDELVPLSQELFDSLFVESDGETTEVIPGSGIRRIKRPPTGETEVTRVTKQRRGQEYFRDIVLNNYGNSCDVTRLPVRELLIASHILPWSSHETERLNLRNGICLNRLHDAAFDQHLIGFDDDLRLVLSKKLKTTLPREAVVHHFELYEGQSLILPEDGTHPEVSFLSAHRKLLIC
jgi:putative restriction endonuclease